MGKYNSTEQRITIPLSEYQRLTEDSRVLNKVVDDGWLGRAHYNLVKEQLEKEDMNDE